MFVTRRYFACFNYLNSCFINLLKKMNKVIKVFKHAPNSCGSGNEFLIGKPRRTHAKKGFCLSLLTSSILFFVSDSHKKKWQENKSISLAESKLYRVELFQLVFCFVKTCLTYFLLINELFRQFCTNFLRRTSSRMFS